MSVSHYLVGCTEAMRRRLAPELRYSQLTFEGHQVEHAKRAQRWLDLGCGHHLLVPWRPEAEAELAGNVPVLVGLDYDLPSLAKHRSIRSLVCGDIRRLPFADGQFDLVTANMVVEHLDDPGVQFAEIARVLAPGGVFLFHTPNLHGYPVVFSRMMPSQLKTKLALLLEGRAEADVFETHYKANRRRDIEALAARSGLAVERFDMTASLPAFSVLPPLALLELLYIRMISRNERLASLRQTLIVTLRKRESRR